MLHIPALWYFGTSVTYRPWFRRVKLVVIPPRFILHQYLWNIAIQPAVGCYNSWANLRCSRSYPLGGKSLWNRSIHRSRWIPLTKASDAELWWFLWSAPEFWAFILRPPQKGHHFADIFKGVFLKENFDIFIDIFIKFSQEFVPKSPVEKNSALV